MKRGTARIINTLVVCIAVALTVMFYMKAEKKENMDFLRLPSSGLSDDTIVWIGGTDGLYHDLKCPNLPEARRESATVAIMRDAGYEKCPKCNGKIMPVQENSGKENNSSL